MAESKRYARFEADGQVHFGLVQDDMIQVLAGNLFANPQPTKTFLPLAEVKLLAPCTPSKAVCVGLNYRRHAQELNMKLPEEPVIFLKPPTAIIGPGDSIVYWPTISQLDYEAELAIVIGKTGRDIEEQDALNYVLGYTIANDVTARDLQGKDGQWTRAKGFDTFLPMGPFIVTGVNGDDLAIQGVLNGQVKQDDRTSTMIFSVAQMVSFVSKVMTLYPGDVILTGTPSGIGPMQVGDQIEIVIEKLGRLTNTIQSAR